MSQLSFTAGCRPSQVYHPFRSSWHYPLKTSILLYIILPPDVWSTIHRLQTLGVRLIVRFIHLFSSRTIATSPYLLLSVVAKSTISCTRISSLTFAVHVIFPLLLVLHVPFCKILCLAFIGHKWDSAFSVYFRFETTSVWYFLIFEYIV